MPPQKAGQLYLAFGSAEDTGRDQLWWALLYAWTLNWNVWVELFFQEQGQTSLGVNLTGLPRRSELLEHVDAPLTGSISRWVFIFLRYLFLGRQDHYLRLASN